MSGAQEEIMSDQDISANGRVNRSVRPLVVHPKWYYFNIAKGSRQKRPPERKLVLVRLASADPGSLPEGIAVGYMRNAAGDKQCPYFVVPGLHTGRALAWCDCLPDGFKWPNTK